MESLIEQLEPDKFEIGQGKIALTPTLSRVREREEERSDGG
jgi:hypothetical protein